jgi:hypothetical protein
MTWALADIDAVLSLKADGLTDREVSARTGVPVATIRTWRRRGLPTRATSRWTACPTCGGELHCWETQLAPDRYAYLLGIYLGDGCLSRWGTGWWLRVALDVAYPGIVKEVSETIAAVRGRLPRVHEDYASRQCVRIESSWRTWPCLFPQHGPGRKPDRQIELVDWQQAIVEREPGPFLRGLIHTDGWRGVNRVHVKGHDYVYPRYQFSNRSADIRKLFTDACDRLGVEWRPWTKFHIGVSRGSSVALLDTFVGPKH